LMVQIQSSWFPLTDRNPQQFMNIMKALPGDFKTAINSIYTTKNSPSFIRVRLLN